jgi:hypothetical protein
VSGLIHQSRYSRPKNLNRLAIWSANHMLKEHVISTMQASAPDQFFLRQYIKASASNSLISGILSLGLQSFTLGSYRPPQKKPIEPRKWLLSNQ